MAYGDRPVCAGPDGAPRQRGRRRVAALAALLLLPGCQTLNRMDYLDQFFDPAGYAARHAPPPAARIGPPRPSPARPDLPAPRDREPPATIAVAAEPSAVQAGETPRRSSAMTETDRHEWIRGTVRQNPWLALNWAQLTTAQQQRIERQLAGPGAGRLAAHGDPASAWDTMGLDDRTELAFGDPGTAAIAATGQDGHAAARRR